MSNSKPPSELLARFGLDKFRPGQEDVIGAVADGKDVLCVMPTGGGKSLCYQLPALLLEGLTIVVSPLIALMKDQVDALEQKGIRATLINSSLTPPEQYDRMQAMAEGAYDLIYIAPERLRNRAFLDAVRKTKVALLAVDEAHCISEWGHDFRPDYARLGQFRSRHLGGVQTIALTATATPTVRTDIVKLLSLHDPKLFITGFSRDNLYFSVQQSSGDRDKDAKLAKFLARQDGCGIIYAATRKRCEEIAVWLPGKLGKPVGIYHGGLDPQQRREMQEDFMAGKFGAIVATNAFGMGIDKSDIRYVVHYNMPGSLEAYYQEAGRAGRDGLPSECLLLFSYSDRYIQEFFIENAYPSREIVQKVYAFLQGRKEDPIELTLDQIKEYTRVSVGTEAIGTAERMLSKTGVLERLDSSANRAALRIDGEHPTLVDMIPRDAKVRRRVLQAAEKIVGSRRGEEVFFQYDQLVSMSQQTDSAVKRSLRELRKLKSFDYIPPFRGRAIHFRDVDVPFHELEIDFEELERRKRSEYEKLDHVIRFAQTPGCRQLSILNYFGDPAAARCGNCDRCGRAHPEGELKTATEAFSGAADVEMDPVEREQLTKVVRIVLSGLARTHGRFGKGLVAQMLAGSQNKKLQQLKLDRLSTYGLLKGLKQAQVSDLLESVCSFGMAEQVEVTQRRPTVKLTKLGEGVMKGTSPLPGTFSLPRALKLKAIACTQSADEKKAEAKPEVKEAGPQPDEALVKTLRQWRREVANEMEIPAFRIFSNATLERIAAQKPTSVSQLEQIEGVNGSAVEEFGHAVIEAIQMSDAEGEASFVETSAKGKANALAEPSTAEKQEPAARSKSADRDASKFEELVDLTPLDYDLQDLDSMDEGADEIEVPADEGDDDDECDVDDGATGQSDAGQSDAYWSWKLLDDGYSAPECCQIRRIDRIQLVIDLIECARDQKPVKMEWLAGDDAGLVAKIARSSSQDLSELLPAHLEPELVDLARVMAKQS